MSCNNGPLRWEILSKFAPSGCRNSFSSDSDGKATRDESTLKGLGWFVLRAGPAAAPLQLSFCPAGRVIIGRQIWVTIESKLTFRTALMADTGGETQNMRAKFLIIIKKRVNQPARRGMFAFHGITRKDHSRCHLQPAIRGSLWVPPAPGSSPSLISGRPITASGVETR